MIETLKIIFSLKLIWKRIFLFFLLLLLCDSLFSQQTTTWTQKPLSTTWESISSDGLVRVECRITSGVSISGNGIMGCTSDATYGNPTPDIFGSPSLELSLSSLFAGTLEFHFFDASTGDVVYLANPLVNVDKVGTYSILPFPLLSGSSTGVFTSTNGSWSNISRNGPIFEFTNTTFNIDSGSLISTNGGECGNGSTTGTGGGTMRMDDAVESINMNAYVSGSLLGFNDEVEFVISNLIIAKPEIEITKTVVNNFSSPVVTGDFVDYTIEVENTGNVKVSNVALTDTFNDAGGNTIELSSAPSFSSATMSSLEGVLLAGEVATYTASHILTANEIAEGGVINQVSVLADSPYGPGDTDDLSDDGDDTDGNLLNDTTDSFFPVPLIDNESVEKNNTVDILVTSNDDFGGNGPDSGSIYLVSTPTNGSVSLNNSGTATNPVDDYFTYTPSTDYIGTDSFTYGITDSQGYTQHATVTITVYTCPNAGIDGTLNICVGDSFANSDLFAQLTGSPDTGGIWVDNNDGTHTYTVAATSPCTIDDESIVTVTQQAPPNAGINGSLNICAGDSFDNDDLFAQLTGSPDTGGTWVDNNDGTHTYTVTATSPCTVDDESIVTVTQQAPPNAGIDGTLNICVGDSFANSDLFAQLTGSPDTGGTWVDNNDGTHTYTVTATSPCAIDDESTVTVTQQAPPNAGIDGTLNICAGDSFDNDDLFAQLTGSPDTGGTWVDNNDGTHTYTVAATSPCTIDDESTVTVTQQAQPNAGIDGTLNICQGETFTNADLFAQLTGSPDTGGTWVDNNDGTHTYTVAATSPCTVDDESIVTVTQQAPPNAGIDGTLNICVGDSFANSDLFAQLTGSPDTGGTWVDNNDGTHTYTVAATSPCTVDDESIVTVIQQAQPNAGVNGTLNICVGDSFDNDDLFVQLTGSPDTGGTWVDNNDGTHTYTVAATSPCTVDDESIVTVTQQAPPNAGIDGTLNICQGETFTNADLFAQLTGSPDTGGTWVDNNDGTHTYTVIATSPCTVDDESTVTVTQQAQPNAGIDGTLNICAGDSFDNDDLFAQLTGSPDTGGTWVDNNDGTHTYTVAATSPCTVDDESIVTVIQQAQPNAGVNGTLNICVGDSFDNDDLFAQLTGSPDTGGTWVDNNDGTHTYTVAATSPCTVDDESTVTVTEQAQPNAGIDGTLNICAGDSFDNDDLFAQLTGSPDTGGTWVDNNDGTHTYTVAATSPCTVDDESIVTVTQQAPPNAGVNGTLNICQGETFTNADLFAQLTGSPDTGGTWVDNNDGTHTYTVAATSPCTIDDESIVTVTEQAQPNAGVNGTLNICAGDSFDNDDLFAQLTGSPDTGGTWVDNYDGTHTYTVTATSPCTVDDESTVTVTQQAQPNAGIDGTLNICAGDSFDNDDLFAQLTGSPDTGGTWVDNNDGTHTYTVAATSPCTVDDESTVTVTQQAQPNAGIDGTLNICAGDSFDNDDLFAQLTGSPDTGGTWVDNNDGTHTYTVAATSPCTVDDESIVAVTQQAPPNAGIDGTLNICAGDSFDNDDLFAQLTGSPDTGGTWVDNNDGTHTYTVAATSPCTVDDESIVTVTQQAPPNAGVNGTLNICTGDSFANSDLFAQLTGSPDTGGTWVDNNDGTHTYTVAATSPCTVDDESTVTVTQQAPPNAGVNGTLNICTGDSFANSDLFAQLTGSPDTGGTWVDNNDGTHTYTVTATSPCTVDDESIVTVIQQAQPNAGIDGTLNICQGETFANSDLFSQLTGSPDTGGTWVDNNDGTHTYTVAATSPCTIDDESIVTVTQQAQPNAGIDGTLNICAGDSFDNDDLFAQLTGSPNAGGTWADNGNNTFTYTVGAIEPCVINDTSIVTVEFNQTDANGNGIVDCKETIIVLPIITIVDVALDNIVNETEAQNLISVTGTVSGDFTPGDIVTLIINTNNYTGPVGENGLFAIVVPGTDLVADADSNIIASVTTLTIEGNTGSASDQHTYIVDTEPPLVDSFETMDTFPILLGLGSPNEILSITVEVGDTGVSLLYVINTDINGIWEIQTDVDEPENGSFPIINPELTLYIIAVDIAGNQGFGEVDIIFNNEPLDNDSDDDGLPDDEEVTIGTDPDNPDTDGDGIIDGQEVLDGTDPLDACDSLGGTPPADAQCDIYVELDLVKPGDIMNGSFEIINIDIFPENTVKIYNRYGVLVWEVEGYENKTKAFSGLSDGRITINRNEKLPSGTYYYDIYYTVRGEQKLLTGYLYVIR
ncbi:cadherin-like domain-containing protein [Maribacter sp. Asnod1-A12]|uniref:cadherin-like domain-containing protein n=1 Tax=Maribacter sp. Asnod1-A12 TaxID=3160576 RepID=UPI003864CD90